MGASLLAKTSFQATSMLNVRPPSRAGSLPQDRCSQFFEHWSTTFADKSPYNPSFVSCLSKDSACKPPTRVAGTFWA
ncbi:hypothetical protein DMX04_24460 [Pseudomonas koreensis]|nr:hypothetical protein DMX04_24460 [Pseudomonas koreensis]